MWRTSYMNTPQEAPQVKPTHGNASCSQKLSHKEAHQVKLAHGHPSCIQKLCKSNIQPWTQPLRS